MDCTGVFMAKLKDLTGQVFGKLTVIKRDLKQYYSGSQGGKPRPIVKWICQCQCGHLGSYFASGLSAGRAKSCRACSFIRPRTSKQIIGQLLSNTKWRANKKNIAFDVNKDYLQQLYDKQNGVCALSGQPIIFAITRTAHKKGETTASIDRIDSCKGYVKGNVQWVHKRINSMKNDMTVDEFLFMCQQVIKTSNLTSNSQSSVQACKP